MGTFLECTQRVRQDRGVFMSANLPRRTWVCVAFVPWPPSF